MTLDALRAALADRYRLERELGAGGMATVYLAEDLKHHRKVAIKVMRPEVSAELAADRFLQEIRTTANLQHPHIVPLFDSGAERLSHPERSDPQDREVEGSPALLWYAMPLIDGESLRARLDREGPLPVDEAIRLVREIADALEYAHSQGILHRDLKPENIMLSRGHALLADFGIARATGVSGRERLTQTGMAIGTPSYMSPEQATGDQDLGPASDVYGLAAILFELLTGEPPFTGATFEAILVKRFTQDAPRLRTRRPEVPEDCDAAIAQALRRDPATRFHSAAAFAAALMRVRDAVPRAMESSIAVMPFANLSPDAENGYFADGLTEEVITTLSKVGTLRVIARSTMMQFRDRAASAAAVASELGVTHVLEGSVRKAGDRLRISASLVAADSNVSLWAERFDGVLADVFDMQDRVAAAVVTALNVVLTPEESRRLTERPLDNAEAYDHYLRARQAFNEMSLTGVDRAFTHLKEALALAPNNVLLLRGLGIGCYSAANTGVRADREELLTQALYYADLIEQQEPASAYSAEIRGLVATVRGQPMEGLRQLGIAFESLPEDVDVASWYAFLLAYSGHHKAADAISRVNMRIAPRHPIGWAGEFFARWHTGQHAAAVTCLEVAPAEAPATALAIFGGVVYLSAGDSDRALESFDAGAALEPDAFTRMCSFLAYAVRGETAAARAALVPEVTPGLWKDFQYAEWIAQGFAMLGDVEESSRWLERAVHLGLGIHEAVTRHSAVWRPWLDHPRFIPIFDALRQNTARYAEIAIAPRALGMVA
ncbi:MAG: protein kinase [Gemmatimonadales bacterium]|nr:protein kinase [Gemmatimonadales bacterium]MDZ4390459.1 protein kinase [Gemmatimonadales bacterium]